MEVHPWTAALTSDNIRGMPTTEDDDSKPPADSESETFRYTRDDKRSLEAVKRLHFPAVKSKSDVLRAAFRLGLPLLHRDPTLLNKVGPLDPADFADPMGDSTLRAGMKGQAPPSADNPSVPQLPPPPSQSVPHHAHAVKPVESPQKKGARTKAINKDLTDQGPLPGDRRRSR